MKTVVEIRVIRVFVEKDALARVKGKKGLKLPSGLLPVDTRIFCPAVENGSRTGAAKLLRVVSHMGPSIVVEPTWGWSRDKLDDDLSFLSLTIGPEQFRTLTADDVHDIGTLSL